MHPRKPILLVLALCLLAAGLAHADRWAVVIGIDGYKTMGRLRSCQNDARAVAQALVATGGYDPDAVVVLTDDAPERPTLGTIRRRIAQLARLARPGDAIFLYFSGHGITNPQDGQGYLVPIDGDVDNAVAFDWVRDTLAASRAGAKVLVLDTCHAGAKGVSGLAPSMRPDLVMLLSSRADEQSHESESMDRSVFSQFLVEGLTGAADADSDRRITPAELFTFVEGSMRRWSFLTGKRQTPLVLPESPPDMILARIPDTPTLSVIAEDADTGAEIAGAEVYVNGKKVGTTPLAGLKVAQGDRLSIEVSGKMLSTHTETLSILRGGRHTVTAKLQRITLRVPDGFRAGPGTKPEPYTNTGWAKEVIHEKTGIEMVFIPAGEFEMGSPSSEKDRDSDEGPAHLVRITKPLYLGEYEVTNGQYQAFIRTAGYDGSGDSDSDYLRHHKDWGKYASTADDYPIVCVGWKNAKAFCDWSGLRLPTEAEWEYACRAGTTTAYSFGNDSGDLGRYAWYGENSGKKTHPVGGKLPNPWGLYDMHGNVWEWCADWYGKDYYGQSSTSDPAGPTSGASRVLRGGSWGYLPGDCRSASRLSYAPSYTRDDLGFRVCVSLPRR